MKMPAHLSVSTQPVRSRSWKRKIQQFGRSLVAIALSLPLLAQPSYANAVVGPGDEGNEVEAIQQRLHDLGYAITVDGVYGEATEQAIRDFQRSQGLYVDGVVGEDTQIALERGLTDSEANTGFEVNNGSTQGEYVGANTGASSNTGNTGRPSQQFVVLIPTDDLATLARVQQLVPNAFINRYRSGLGPFIQVASYNPRDRYMAENQYRYLQRQGFRDAHVRVF